MLKKFFFIVFVSLLLAGQALAQQASYVTNSTVTMETDGTNPDGSANIQTNNAGPIQFFTNRTLRGYIDGTTGVLTGFTLGTVTLTNPTISENLTFSSASANIIPGATSLTFRNNADSADNLSLTDAGLVAIPRVGISVGGTFPATDVTQPSLWIQSDANSKAQTIFQQSTADATGPLVNFYKTRSTDGTADTIVVNGDSLGAITAYGSNGTTYSAAAQIVFNSGGVPGASNDMPGRITFNTVADGSGSMTNALILYANKLAEFYGAITSTNTITSSRTTDLGWAVVDGTDNTACNTQCSSAAVFGLNLAAGATAPVIVGPADATADICLCAGAS